MTAASYAPVKRRLPAYPQEAWRQRLSASCAAHAGLGRPAWSFTTYPRSTSRPIRATGSASRDSPRSADWSGRFTIGLLTVQDGFPLMGCLRLRSAGDPGVCRSNPASAFPPASRLLLTTPRPSAGRTGWRKSSTHGSPRPVRPPCGRATACVLQAPGYGRRGCRTSSRIF